MVFYFTATGNSLYAAKQFSDKPISIPQIIHKDSLIFEDSSIGIVFPVYCNMPPSIVVDFLNKATFKTDYFYTILTYGNRHSGAAEYTRQIAEQAGVKLDYACNILMADNYLPVFDMNEQMIIDKRVDEQLSKAVNDVKAQRRYIPPITDEEIKHHEELMEMNKKMPQFNNGEQLMFKDECTGCGICTKVCPIENISVENSRAVRKSEKCLFCLACIQNCPCKAIGLKIMDKNPNARYRNEHISLTEIIEANNQNKK